MEKPVVPVGKQMEWFVPTENFRKKSNTFRGITFFSLLPKRPEFSVPFVHITRPWLLSQREQRDSSQDSGYKRNFICASLYVRKLLLCVAVDGLLFSAQL